VKNADPGNDEPNYDISEDICRIEVECHPAFVDYIKDVAAGTNVMSIRMPKKKELLNETCIKSCLAKFDLNQYSMTLSF